MKTVYVTQETEFDFTDAERWGDIVFLTHDDLFNHRDSDHNRIVMANIRRRLTAFSATSDYILIAGSPYVAAAVFNMLGTMGYDSIRVLRWSNRDRVYTPILINTAQEVMTS